MAKRKRGNDDARSGVVESSKKVKVTSNSNDYSQRSRTLTRNGPTPLQKTVSPQIRVPTGGTHVASPDLALDQGKDGVRSEIDHSEHQEIEIAKKQGGRQRKRKRAQPDVAQLSKLGGDVTVKSAPGTATSGRKDAAPSTEQRQAVTSQTSAPSLLQREDRKRPNQEPKTLAQPSLKRRTKQEARLAKRERRLQRRVLKELNQANGAPNEHEAASTELGKRISKEDKVQKRPKGTPTWTMSNMSGGQMLDMDSRFSDDEKSILIAFTSAVNVYATGTSLLSHKLRLRDERDTVSGFSFSTSVSNHLYIGSRSGFIDEWDWREGKRLGSWNTQCSIRALATATTTESTTTDRMVFTSDETFGGDSPYAITAHRLFGGDEADKTDLKTLWRSDKPVQSLQVFEAGRNIVATSEDTILIGTTADPNPTKLTDLVYSWRQISCSQHITSVDVRSKALVANSEKTSQKTKRPHPSFDIAIGTLFGIIFIYRDLSAAHASNPSYSFQDPQRIHWHRNAVSSVKWSKDGNYLISGGQETVLVIHQLSTGRQQFLPNLIAPITSIVVSPTGSSYAINLAENSAMIVSSTELKPTFAVAGLRLAHPRNPISAAMVVPIVESPYAAFKPLSRTRMPYTIHPVHHSRLLAAVVSSTEPTANQSATYLQTIDIPSALGITTQALTRTTATLKNIAPSATGISTPDVTHISISSDGTWLATVDEWVPPVNDLDPLAFDYEEALQSQASKKEVYLKFWSQSPESDDWALSTRIDNANTPNFGTPPSILALASDPSFNEFVTLGFDGYVSFWAPSNRIRDGQPVFDQSDTALMNWKCAHTIHLVAPAASPDENRVPQAGYLAYSLDGTVCVAGYRIADPMEVFVINTVSGELATTIVSTFPSPLLLGIGMLSRSLVLFHPGELEIHDLVNNTVAYIELSKMSKSKDPRKVLDAARLTVDAEVGLIAVGFLDRAKGDTSVGSLKSRLQIFNVSSIEHSSTPIFEKTFYRGISEILCSHPPTRQGTTESGASDALTRKRNARKQGFVVIDRTAQICTLNPASSALVPSSDIADPAPQQVPTPPPSENAAQDPTTNISESGPLARMFSTSKSSSQSASAPQQALVHTSLDDTDMVTTDANVKDPNLLDTLLANLNDEVPSPEYPVVSAERLAEVFDNAAVGGNGFLPPVGVLFRDVVRLLTGRG